jgi:uncharacterized protein (TIGR03437 family)
MRHSHLLTNAIVVAVLCAGSTFASDRITAPIDGSERAILPDLVRKISRAYVDEGPIEPSQAMDALILYLKPSPAQQTALNRLLADLHNPASPKYHDWLTPEQYADQFGISVSDAHQLTAWLESQGFQVGWVGRGRSVIVFQGTAGMVESAFHPGLHRFRSSKAVHYANTRNPSVPQALEGVVRAIGGLNDFYPEPDLRPAPKYTSSTGVHSLGPDDLATIYDFASLLSSGIDGTGQTLVIAGESEVQPSDLTDFQTLYNLAAPNVQMMTVPNMPNPGYTSAQSEADLDLQAAMSVARNATLLFLYTKNAYNAVTYAIDHNLGPVINVSFHIGCDSSAGSGELLLYQSLAQQGNTEGITWVNSSGDIGAAGCDSNGEAFAKDGLATRFPADIPEVTGVGGTMFNDQNGNYWSTTNDPQGGSALSYIPEAAWNETTGGGIEASTGGVSSFFAKPSWQTGPGVPNDGQRDQPDVALAAAGNTDPFMVYSNGQLKVGGGTSQAAPIFSAMLTLINQYLVANKAQTKPGLGNANVLLYSIAQSTPAAFHDITSGNNIVPCAVGSPDCGTGQMGYSAGPGYDLCTGLGSVDLAKLAPAFVPTPTGPTLAITASGNGASFQPVYAPGMLMTLYGSDLGTGSASSSTLPLPNSLEGFSATVNGVAAPIYYVSPAQVNVQIPYGTQPGTATLMISQGGQTATSQLPIAAAAPGIFTDANGNTVPYASGSAGQTLILYITGDGEVSPALPTGTAPTTATPVTALPKSVLPLTLTIGGQTAATTFYGIPYGLVGVTQINFVVPSGLAAGPQPVVVTVGTASSKAATFTVTGGS